MRKRLADLRFQEEIGNIKSKISDTEQLLKEERKVRYQLIFDGVLNKYYTNKFRQDQD